jgi:hypothetical protein
MRPCNLTVAIVSLAACADLEDRSTHWPTLHATIVEPHCATSGCHARMTSQGGLDLSTPESAFTALTGRVCYDEAPPGQPPGNFVFPGDPDRSKLIHMLEGDYVYRMPPDSPLATYEIGLMRRWIEEGAPCD